MQFLGTNIVLSASESKLLSEVAGYIDDGLYYEIPCGPLTDEVMYVSEQEINEILGKWIKTDDNQSIT